MLQLLVEMFLRKLVNNLQGNMKPVQTKFSWGTYFQTLYYGGHSCGPKHKTLMQKSENTENKKKMYTYLYGHQQQFFILKITS